MVFVKGHNAWNKGVPRSEETRRKISKALKGKRLSEEHRRKLAEAKKGERNPNYGKPRSEETRRKIGEANRKTMKENWQNPEYREHMVRVHKGKPSPRKGMKLSKEWRQKLSEAHKGIQAGENHPMYGKKLSEEHRRKLSEAHMGKKLSEETKRKISEASKRLWQDPEYREKVVRRTLEGAQVKPNKLETQMDSLLQEHFPDEWRYVGDGQVIIGGLCPDFINYNGQKKIIEVFGDYWHDPTKRRLRPNYTEEGRRETYSQFGFEMLVIWEHEFEDPVEVVEKISSFATVSGDQVSYAGVV